MDQMKSSNEIPIYSIRNLWITAVAATSLPQQAQRTSGSAIEMGQFLSEHTACSEFHGICVPGKIASCKVNGGMQIILAT